MGFISGPAKKDNNQILHAIFGDWDTQKEEYVCSEDVTQQLRQNLSNYLCPAYCDVFSFTSKAAIAFDKQKYDIEASILTIIRDKKKLDPKAYPKLAYANKQYLKGEGPYLNRNTNPFFHGKSYNDNSFRLLKDDVYLKEYRKYVENAEGPILSCELPLIANAFSICLEVFVLNNQNKLTLSANHLPFALTDETLKDFNPDCIKLYFTQNGNCYRLVELELPEHLTLQHRQKHTRSKAFPAQTNSSSPSEKNSEDEKENIWSFTPLSPVPTKNHSSSEEISPSELRSLSPWELSPQIK